MLKKIHEHALTRQKEAIMQCENDARICTHPTSKPVSYAIKLKLNVRSFGAMSCCFGAYIFHKLFLICV